MSKRLTTKEFIERARKVHGDKYDYSKVEYITGRVDVCIICPTHGEFWQKPESHLQGRGCQECGWDITRNCQRSNRWEFIAKARAVHGDKYDYSLVDYKNCATKVCIICPKHGGFWQRPNDHKRGDGCPICKSEKKKNLMYGRFVNDLTLERQSPMYKTWNRMIQRCYRNARCYEDCEVCEEWYHLSNFKTWFDKNYVAGYSLDKDILSNGSKIYSPDTCCFVPQEINMLVVQRKNMKNYGTTKTKNGYSVNILINGKLTKIGIFSTVEDAKVAYKQAKESYIKEVATSYYDNGKITKRVYDALMRYEIKY